ncbi:eCIS core domain-containing protein [Streptomyces violarus]|uniref:eCIS core domain-containing protein n=1 Tax=Streptomyces violarus TaxID=67380 RepID=UPI0021C21A1B|nr:DUF4157 domain-containing protein [Streptomyces violarus]MCT9143691.1 DUF4157 domain-containing protein [Streptomyces violarus]
MHAHGTGGRRAADRDDVRANTPGVPVHPMLALQRMAGNAAVARTVAEERHEHDAHCGHTPSVQRRALVHDVLNTPGQRMDSGLQTEMEARFGGADFSGVRVHKGPLARESAAELGAKAYTSGAHIVEGAPLTKEDWAHELTHFQDQMAGPVPGTDNGAGVKMSDIGDSGERHAVDNARRVMNGPVPAVQPAPAEGAAGPGGGAPDRGTVQRTVWTFDQAASVQDERERPHYRWRSEGGAGAPKTSAELGLDPGRKPHPGDTYDDESERLHSSENVAFSTKGRITEQDLVRRRTQTSRAVAEAKQRIASALKMLREADGDPKGALLAGLESGFPVFRTAPPGQLAPFLPRIAEIIQRIHDGLNAQGAKIALVGSGVPGVPQNATAWVDGNLSENVAGLFSLGHDKMSEELPPLMERSGPIHLLEPGQIAWYIVHEATHRFAGTLDYQYSPYFEEVQEDEFTASADPEVAAAMEPAMLDRRKVRDPKEFNGKDEQTYLGKQSNWYALGRRALMNADSYAQFVLTATGAPAPRT